MIKRANFKVLIMQTIVLLEGHNLLSIIWTVQIYLTLNFAIHSTFNLKMQSMLSVI